MSDLGRLRQRISSSRTAHATYWKLANWKRRPVKLLDTCCSKSFESEKLEGEKQI